MLKPSLRWLWALLATVLFHSPAFAEDSDLFASPSSSAAANVMFVFDNAASFSANAGGKFCNINLSTGTVTTEVNDPANRTDMSETAGGVEQCALFAALNSLAANTTATFNISFVMYNATGMKKYNPSTDTYSACPGAGGGCVVLELSEWKPAIKANVLKWIRAWTTSSNGNANIKVNNRANGSAMQEAWAYFKGRTGLSGTTYTAPTLGCGKNFIIYVGNAWQNNAKPTDPTGAAGPKMYLQQGSNSQTGKFANPKPTDKELQSYTDTVTAEYSLPNTTTKLVCKSGSSSSFTFADDEGSGSWGLNWAMYMANEGGIKTSAVGLLGVDCLPSYSAWLQRLAVAGGGDFYPANDYTSLAAAVKSAASNIISANSVFASVSLPVAVNTQGSYLNQVFVGMFRPDEKFLPRWNGNIKQYRLGFTSAKALKLMDAQEPAVEAINSNTGFIKPCARSFWTPTTDPDAYWAAEKSGECTDPVNDQFDTPDGNVVEKGAQSYKLRHTDPASRSLWTCGDTFTSCDRTWTRFDTNLTTTATTVFTGMASADKQTLINWARGVNSQNELTKGTTVMRPSAHGDVMHSRPVAVNYGTEAQPNVVVYYGANDGFLHAVNGNQTTTISITSTGGGSTTTTTWTAGSEIWAFMPAEFYTSRNDSGTTTATLAPIQRIYDNNVPVFYKGTAADGAKNKPYGMDGPVAAFKGTISGSNKVYIFAAMRRGGRGLYAMDVSDPGRPAMLWKIGCNGGSMSSTDCGSNSGGSSRNYGQIGQTWAPPRVIFSNAVGSGRTPLLLMGGGYDPCEDFDGGTGGANNNCTSSNKGNRVYVIDATDGSIVKEFQTVAPFSGGAPRGVVGEPTVVSSSGIAQYAYIADLGGVVYRIDLTDNDTGNWRMKPIAKLGCDSPSSTCTANRKFMFQPSVVSTDNVTFQILLGSGDREKPTTQYGASNGVQNYFFMLKDKPGDDHFLENACGDNNNFICIGPLTDGSSPLVAITTSTPSSTVLQEKKGWYLRLKSTEQVVTGAITLFGITTFSTHQPAVFTGSCTNSLGTSLVYNISYKDAAPAVGNERFQDLAGDGLPPSPVAGKVKIGDSEVPFCIGCSGDSPLEGSQASQLSSVSRAKSRLYWYLEKN